MGESKKTKKLLQGVLSLSVMLIMFASATVISAAADITVGLTSPTGTFPSAAATYVDSGITVTCTDNLTGGTVNINGFVSGDTLTYTNSGGVSGSYNNSNGVLTISGIASADAYQTFLRSIKFNTSSSDGARTIEIILSNTSGTVMFYGGHYYQYVPTGMTWAAARVAAAAMTYPGVAGNGYLATITTDAENTFISEKLGNDAWIGGSDNAVEGTWCWVEGPEVGHPMSEYQTNWAPGEPNNWGGDEDYTEIYVANGTWNDLRGTQNYGYVVEYGYSSYTLSGGSGSASKAITIVTKLTPTYTTPSDRTATYGQTLSEVALPSGFSWEAIGSTPVGDVGDNDFTVKFTPDNTDLYNIVTGISVTIQVSKAIPTVSTPAPAPVTYAPNKTLNDISLPSKWSWDSPSTVPTFGNSGFAVTYTPSASDLQNYDFSGISDWNVGTNKVNRIASLTVNKAIPTITTPAPTAITYSPITSLSAITLASEWTWDSPATVPTVSNSGFAVTYTPSASELLNYDFSGISGWDIGNSTVNRTASLTVNKADPVVTWPTISAITYGDTFQNAVGVDGVSDVAGSFIIEDTASIPGVAGSPYSKTLYFNPTYAEGYNTLSTPSIITVTKANAVLSDIVCADKSYDLLPLSPSANIVIGEGIVLFTYSGTDIAGTTTISPSGAGIYIITATLPASANYNEAIKTKTGVSIWRKSSSHYDLDKVDVVVNGKVQTADKTEGTNADGQAVTTVTLDSAKVNAQLSENHSNPNVVIPVSGSSDVAIGGLTGEMIKSMEAKAATVELRTETETYTVPAAEINIDSVSKQLGQAVALSDIEVRISIAKPLDDTVKIVANAAEVGGFTIAVPAINFTITCTYGGKTVDVKHFNSYVERTVAIPEGIDPSQITTGVVVDPDGTTRQVPTKITLIDGKYYAVINSLTNSTYAVVWHPITFSDVASHWAKDSVNDMGSRMIVSGIDENNYKPDRDITRAEFAAIIVRALGLQPGTGKTIFSDVKSSSWYAGYVETASEYGIISGYTNSTFGPSDQITREQAMSMIDRATKITGLDSSVAASNVASLLAGFSDASATSDYAKASVASCIQAGLVSGKSANLIAPKDKITRAEVAVIVQKLLQKSNLI